MRIAKPWLAVLVTATLSYFEEPLMPIKVLVIDDSALIRQLLTEILQTDPGIVVVGAAPDAYVAREKIKELDPDVLTLDVEMPKMDGVTFLRNLMRLRPMPVVMISSLTERGGDITLACLELGAIDFVTKPKIDVAHGVEKMAKEIVAKVKAAASVRFQGMICEIEQNSVPEIALSARGDEPQMNDIASSNVIAIGASTGGTEAIKHVLMRMPVDSPAVVITQHIPSPFSASFAKRLDSQVALSVHEARDGQILLRGHAYIAPGDQHLLVERQADQLVCKLFDGPPVNLHKPSVDVMFRSVAHAVGNRAIAVLLTGMGVDGARGMEELKGLGVATIAQDEATSVVWGMPGEAYRRGCVDHLLPLPDIAIRIIRLAATL
jgi:two-component system, chemotaxis family, protein-glutamate methylesterase/glutaminase